MRTTVNILLTILLLFSSGPVFAGRGAAGVDVRDAVVRMDGGHVYVTFTVETSRFPKDYKLTLVPVLYDDNANALTLEPMTLAGRRKSITDRRSGFVSGDRREVTGRRVTEYRYAAAVKSREWMDRVSLTVYWFGEGCGRQAEESAVVLADGRLIRYQTVPSFEKRRIEPTTASPAEKFSLENPFLRPLSGYADRFRLIDEGTEDASATVYFRVGSYELDPYYKDNSRMLASITEAYRAILNDPSVRLEKIFIAGFASPEGSLALNTELGQRRAEAVENYLMRELGVADPAKFEIYNGRENWEGLRRMVAASDMPERDKVLYIIDRHSTGEEIRKEKLKYFADGVPYSYMLTRFYPKLRSAGYVQIYYAKNETAAARRVENDTRDVELLNRASELMIGGDWNRALAVLEGAKDDPRSYNSIGVCLMMTGDYDRADSWFLRALEAGDPYAAGNLRQTQAAHRVDR